MREDSETKAYPEIQTKKIDGAVLRQKYFLSTKEILELMKAGLTATTIGGDVVYNTDYSPEEEGNLIPSLKERREAARRFTINQMRIERGQPHNDDISQWPEKYRGMSFELPKSQEKQKELEETIREFLFDRGKFEQMTGKANAPPSDSKEQRGQCPPELDSNTGIDISNEQALNDAISADA